MSESNVVFKNLRQKLDLFGYKRFLPLGAVPLVSVVFEDLVKTTENLRDAKKEVAKLLEDKSCWDLGVEPYKCDNLRLLTECNQLHLVSLKQQEESEKRACEYNKIIRNLETDIFHLEEQCTLLQKQIHTLSVKQIRNSTVEKDLKFKSKKPFITAVRQELPPLQSQGDYVSKARCSKYNPLSCTQRSEFVVKTHLNRDIEINNLQNNIYDLSEEIAFYKLKVKARDREIQRLNDLLTGGRPPAALAKDLYYKQIDILTADLKTLQREKSNHFNKLHTYQNRMQEAMERAINLETSNRKLCIDLDEFKKVALQVEQQANDDVVNRERDIQKLKMETQKLFSNLKETSNSILNNRGSSEKLNVSLADSKNHNTELNFNMDEKRYLKEKLNTITQMELKNLNQTFHKRILKLKRKVTSIRQELTDCSSQKEILDKEKNRIKTERDFFQKEYLRLVSKTDTEKENSLLQHEINCKDKEMRLLLGELGDYDVHNLPTTPLTDKSCFYPQSEQQYITTEMSSISHNCCLQNPFQSTETVPIGYESLQGIDKICKECCKVETSGDCKDKSVSNRVCYCIKAAVLRAERERDVAYAEVTRLSTELDKLREQHASLLQTQTDETKITLQRYEELTERIRELERENSYIRSASQPSETQVIMLKEEVEDLRRRLSESQEESCMLKTNLAQLKILRDQIGHSMLHCQNKLSLAENQLESANLRLNTVNSSRETAKEQNIQLTSEINTFKQTNSNLQHEKDSLLSELNIKTLRLSELELELKICHNKSQNLETHLTELEKKNEELFDKYLKYKAENKYLKIQNGENVKENESLKKKVANYIYEIQKTEDILLQKEKEREEMLEQYTRLSQDIVALQGNNKSLEEEEAEC